MFKNLLVLIPSERPARPVIDGAVLLTMAYGAHLDALSVAYETANVPIAAAGGAAVHDRRRDPAARTRARRGRDARFRGRGEARRDIVYLPHDERDTA
ncbi:hypothetical protein [Bradyrhizobium sp. 31Argb]|uniref:hypothetical protein n=1 Tax=Bradyrhizobium sp. 31Argb TaxID=3141247 RepID=UPI003749703E